MNAQPTDAFNVPSINYLTGVPSYIDISYTATYNIFNTVNGYIPLYIDVVCPTVTSTVNTGIADRVAPPPVSDTINIGQRKSN